MNIITLFNQLGELGVELYVDNNKLKSRGPKGVLTAELTQFIMANKALIITTLEASQSSDAPQLKRVTSNGVYPLAQTQRRLWFVEQLGDTSAGYSIPLALKMSGELNTDRLQSSFDQLIKRHHVLGANIFETDGKVSQQFNHRQPFELKKVLLPEGQSLEQLMNDFFNQPFDLALDRLIRATVVKLGHNEHVLLINMHHIIADGWSVGVLLKELVGSYTLLALGGSAQGADLAELPIQFGDYCHWQQALSGSDVQRKQIDYWRNQLKDAPALLSLPYSRPRPAKTTTNGDAKYIHINSELSNKLNHFGSQCGITLYTLMLGAFNLLLARYSAQNDIVVGTPTANRPKPELEPLIGFFANTVILRSQVNQEQNIVDYLKQFGQITTKAFDNQDVSIEQLIDELKPERNLSYSPLFQVLFSLQNTPLDNLSLPGLTVQPLGKQKTTAKYDLSLNVSPLSDSMQCEFEYNTDLFDGALIERMASQYENLLAAMVSAENPNVGQLVAQIETLPANERHKLIYQLNEPAYQENPKAQFIHQLFEAQVEQTPNAIAVVFETQQLTYQALNESSNRLAHKLRGQGVKADTLVGICVTRGLDTLVGIMAILKAGGAYVPLDPNYPQSRLDYILQDTGLKHLLSQSALTDKLNTTANVQVSLLDEQLGGQSLAQLAQPFAQNLPQTNLAILPGQSPASLSHIIYTSGSTGKPKGVMVEHQNVTTFLHWSAQTFTPHELSCVLASTSVNFDLSVFEMFAPLVTGGCCLIVDSILSLLDRSHEQQNITMINTVPSGVTAVLKEKAIPDSVVTINLAGEALKQVLVDSLYENTTVERVYNLYGPSEDTTYSLFALAKKGDAEPLIGRPITNTQAYILDGAGQLAPFGTAGELFLGGAGVTRGYLNREALTQDRYIANSFIERTGDRLYRTGDLVRYMPDGNIAFIGRLDDQVKIRGFRIELGEIEHQLAQSDFIDSAIVMAKEGGSGDQRLLAYIVPKDTNGADEQGLIAQLKQNLLASLPEYMCPSAFVILTDWPLTPNGKIDKKALPAPDAATQQGKYEPPVTQTEKALANIWAKLLDLPVEQISAGANFFALGGHSLLSVLLVAHIRSEFNQSLPVQVIFECSVLRALAGAIDSKEQKQWSPMVGFKTGGDLTPYFCIHAGAGVVDHYIKASQCFADDRPFYGIQCPGLEEGQALYPNIEALAKYYLLEIKNIQPHGPYNIGGYCMGGLIALEVVQQLTAMGDEINGLSMFDSFTAKKGPHRAPIHCDVELFELMIKEGIDSEVEAVMNAGTHKDETFSQLVDVAKTAGIIPQEVSLAQVRRYVRLNEHNMQLINHYKPKPYHGNIVFFNALNSEGNNDVKNEGNSAIDSWKSLNNQQVTQYDIECGHSDLFLEPHVGKVIKQLAEHLS